MGKIHLETISRPRRRDWDYIPALQSITETEIALVLVPKTTCTELTCPCTELDMYRSGHVLPNTYFSEPKWYIPKVTGTESDLPHTKYAVANRPTVGRLVHGLAGRQVRPPTPIEPRCRLCIHIPHYPHPNPNPNLKPNPKSYPNLKLFNEWVSE